MAEERIDMSQRERDRLKVLHEVEQGEIQQQEAAERLQLSTRQVRRLERRVREEGDAGVIHRLRGRPSNRKLAGAIEQRAVEWMRDPVHAGFGPTLAAEHLGKEGITVSRETVRRWMSRAGLWQPRRQKIEAVHVWRQRRAAFGELVMWDASEHAWLEERGPGLQLIAMIDDATSRIWGRFTAHDTVEENLKVLKDWLERHGRPVAFYTDKAALFYASRGVQIEEELRGTYRPRTQIARALAELDIRWIAAHSPQAKGRMERLFGTLQNRLVKEMRLAGVNTAEEANRYWEEQFVPFWERRFTVAARDARDAHRPLGEETRLESVLSQRQFRQIGNDYTVSWGGQRFGAPREEVRPGLRGARVELELRLDGSRWVRFRGNYLTLVACGAEAAASPSGLRPPGLAEGKPKNQIRVTTKTIPPPDHPWKRTFL